MRTHITWCDQYTHGDMSILTTGFYVVKSSLMWLKVVECG